MKSNHNSIKLTYIFTIYFAFALFVNHFSGYAQGFNDNEWIFGYCGTAAENNYLSFGKGNTATVQTLHHDILIGENNNAIAIDPITGQPLFFTNGELVYDNRPGPIQGAAPGLKGNIDGTQQVATGFLEYDPDGNKLFYIFYVSPSGELQYALVDMNAAGQASGNERPLGEVTQKNQPIGSASGAILVVKTPSSPSYLLSFNGGSLSAQRLESTAGSFTATDTEPIPFVPERIIFHEDSGKLILLPTDASNQIVVLDFDSSGGTFGSPTPITQVSGSGNYGGADISPDGTYLYYSLGNQLYRVPTDDLDATPEIIPIDLPGQTPTPPFAVHDVKIGPDGSLYYIYEEAAGGPQLLGKVANPDEADPTLLNVEKDPFAGTDFCGTVFPTFAPNADIEPTVDFTWSPDMPCSKNPVQLTSHITPENYRPVSYSWNFSPPLTDSSGNELPVDYTQEHFLIPKDATSETSVTVGLTVTFADGTTKTVPDKVIQLTENKLEANFTPSDTTLCESCIDIEPLLSAQSQGEGGGTGGGGQGGGGDNYEYFWSNKREEGWIPKGSNEVCKPGLYWVLVREPGSGCYAYAEIRVKMWDVKDQANNIWYFGDGAGLDFNPDPDNPDAPIPRPIAERHPQNIPAGTTTISDQAGQVLFYTDGQSVWDLNGQLMENGDNIGGDNSSTQSVLAVPVAGEETLFYLFTNQQSSAGQNEAKFSLVDIKSDNPTGVGNVVTKDNFLFSPSTEQMAGLDAGDTTWVMYHELGNNTFRAYPVSKEGIGQAVLNSVGSDHGFNSGVGSMKFNADGDKLAVTITEGGCSKLELFDFDSKTGEMGEYAMLDLGCNGEAYGLEFSEDGQRVFVSYRNGGPGIEEFQIKAVENDDENAAVCPACFEGATDQSAIEACIISTRSQISQTSGSDLGAIQIGPNGQIYVAVVGSNKIGQISVGAGCTTESTFNQDGVEAMPGTSNLGLPSFVQNSGSSIPEPSLSAPSRLCIDPEEGASALLEGGGEADIDSYFWTITHEDGTVIISEFGGPGEEFQKLDQPFDRAGKYTIDLRVDRCGDADYYEESTEILVQAPPELTLADDATLCSGTPVTLTAIEGYDPAEGLYDFQWTNAAGQVFGDENSNEITVEDESIYTVKVNYRLPDGLTEEEAAQYESCPATAEIFVGPAFEFEITPSEDEVCYGEVTVNFVPDTPISGEWFYTLDGDTARTSLGEFFELELAVNTLPGPGQYEIIFVTTDPILAGCTVEKKVDLLVNELPLFTAVQTTPAADCAAADGAFEITMQGAAETLTIVETGDTYNNVLSGNSISVADLLPGIYTIKATNSTGCTYTATVAVENSNPPSGFDYTIATTEEVCDATGIGNGTLSITFDSPQSGSYIVTRQGDGQEFTASFSNIATVNIPLPHGEYSVEVRDLANCSVPDPGLYTVDRKMEAIFSVPTTITSCGSYTFSPLSEDQLNYTLTGPSGTTISPDTTSEFTISESGTYTITGEDPTGENCPKTETMVVSLTAAIDFDVSPPSVDCQAGVQYEALLTNADPADVLFLWKDNLGVIVGRRQTFVPSRPGEYTLEVQPATGGLCPVDKKPFTAETLSERVEVTLDVVPFCGDQTSTTITVDADLTSVADIEWYTVVGNTRTRVPAFNGLPLIEVSEEGTYEAVLRSSVGCDLGRARGTVVRSTIIPPVIPESITICAIEGVQESISPGSYDNYSWKLNGVEVSQDSVFTPTDPGIYELTVSDNVGCEYISTIEVIEDCALKITFPSGVVLEDPDRNFILYANEYIDGVEVYIYNRWGELIFYCEHENLEPKQPFCPWNGEVNGKFVPNGTYAVVVKFTSGQQNKTEKIIKAITVIQ